MTDRVLPRFRRSLLGLCLGVGLTMGLAVAPALAVNMLSQTVAVGGRSVSVADLALPALTYANTAQTSTGNATLTVDDSSGTGLGWNVTVQSSAWVYTGSYAGTNIPAANVALTSASAATAAGGQAVNVAGGPKPPSGASGTLDVARLVLQADPDFGQGSYTQSLGIRLTLPAQSEPGTYTGTVTVSITAGP